MPDLNMSGNALVHSTGGKLDSALTNINWTMLASYDKNVRIFFYPYTKKPTELAILWNAIISRVISNGSNSLVLTTITIMHLSDTKVIR